MSPTLTAPDVFAERPEASQRFAAEVGDRMVARLQLTCGLGLLLVPLFFALDLVVHPRVILPLLGIRLTMMLLFVLALVATRTARGRRAIAALSSLMVWQAGFGIVLMTALEGGASSGYYAGVNLVMLAAAVLLPLDTALSLAIAGALIGSYVGVCVFWGGIPDAAVFAQNLFFLGSTALIMVISHRTARHAHQHEFLQRLALETAEHLDGLKPGSMQDTLHLEAEHAVQSERLCAPEGERFAPLAVLLMFTHYRRSLCRRFERTGLADGEGVSRPRIGDLGGGFEATAGRGRQSGQPLEVLMVQMDGQGAARDQMAKEVAQAGPLVFRGKHVLKRVAGDQGQAEVFTQVEFPHVGLDPADGLACSPGDLEHRRRVVQPDQRMGQLCQLLRDASGAAANFKHAPGGLRWQAAIELDLSGPVGNGQVV